MKKIYRLSVFLFAAMFLMAGCQKDDSAAPTSASVSASVSETVSEVSAEPEVSVEAEESTELSAVEEETIEGSVTEPEVGEEAVAEEPEPAEETQTTQTTQTVDVSAESNVLYWNDGWTYASNSAIHSDTVTLYCTQTANRKNITVAINAGHGTSGGSGVQTLCHPDGSAKVTGGSTAAGATTATAVSGGTSFLDGTSEASATLSLAKLTKDRLLAAGYDVLMIRETDDCQLDNIARTVFANQYADCHISLHYDSTESNKGVFYCSVPDVASYRSMEPVASHWQQHNALGESLLGGMRAQGNAIYGSGSMALDLTQTSYSTVPSVDLEVGDRASDYSQSAQQKLADGIVAGVNLYFGY